MTYLITSLISCSFAHTGSLHCISSGQHWSEQLLPRGGQESIRCAGGGVGKAVSRYGGVLMQRSQFSSLRVCLRGLQKLVCWNPYM